MVVLNLDTFVQYQGLKIKAMNEILEARKPVTEEEAPIEPELTEAELNKFFDSYEKLPIELGDDVIDDDLYQFFDPLAVHDLCQITSCMDCVVSTAEEEIAMDQEQQLMANGPTTFNRGLTDEKCSPYLHLIHTL